MATATAVTKVATRGLNILISSGYGCYRSVSSLRGSKLRRASSARVEGRGAEFTGWQNLRTRRLPARRLRQHQAVAGTIGGIGPPVAYLDGLLHQVIEILEGIFEPFDLGQRARHVQAELEEGVAETDRD